MQNNNEEFQVIKAKPKKHVRKSGLYNFLITDNTWIERAGLNSKKVTKKLGYLIIELDIANIPKIANMQALNWHIRVDESYERKKKFLSQWHYTIEFLDSDGQTKVLHAYYHIGLFQYITMDGVEILDTEIINIVNDHCIHARDVALNLITILQDTQKKLESDFTKIASELYEVKALSLKDERIEKVLTQCRKLHASLQEIDEESSQAPLKFLENRANFIRTRREALAKPQEAKQDEEEINTKSASMPTAKKTASKKSHKAAPKPMVDDKTMQSINARIANIKKALLSDVAKNILEAHKVINKIEREILELYKKYAGSTRELDDVYLEIAGFKNLPDIFKDLVAAEKFDAAIDLFKAGYGDQTVFFYAELLAYICNFTQKSDEHQVEYVKFCSFLYDNSEHYRTALFVALNTIVPYKIRSVEVGESFLLRLALRDKNILFKMFFKQVNSTVIIAQRCGDRAADILSAIYARESDNVELISFLLEQGYPSEHSPEQFDTALKGLVNRAENFLGYGAVLMLEGDKLARSFLQDKLMTQIRDVVAVPSVFYHACLRYSDYECDMTVTRENLLDLARKSSLLYLILGLSVLIGTVDQTMRLPCAGAPLFAFFQDDKDRMMIAKSMAKVSDGSTSIATLMLVNDKNDYDLFSDIIKIFSEKIDKISPEDKGGVHRKLLDMIIAEKAVKNTVRSYNKLFALHMASVISASLLPQTRSTYALVKESVNACVVNLRNFADEFNDSVVRKTMLCQSILDADLVPSFITGFEMLAGDLEKFDYWKRNPQINSATPLYDHMQERYHRFLQLQNANEEEEGIASTLADDSKAEPKDKKGCYLN